MSSSCLWIEMREGGTNFFFLNFSRSTPIAKLHRHHLCRRRHHKPTAKAVGTRHTITLDAIAEPAPPVAAYLSPTSLLLLLSWNRRRKNTISDHHHLRSPPHISSPPFHPFFHSMNTLQPPDLTRARRLRKKNERKR